MYLKKRRKHKTKSYIAIIILISFVCIMTIGYAAFNTNLTINTKGNIKTPNASQQLKNTVVSTGDGLYQDPNIENRYIYKGTNPNNYINFDNELWRVVSIESDNTLKIVKEEAIANMPWDERTTETTGPRLNSNNTYCQLYASGYYYGCNAWSAINGTFTNGQYNGTVTENASLNNYLNNVYYQSLSEESKKIIETHEFNAGAIEAPSSSNQLPISEVIANEKQYIWNGNIALLNVSDYLNASLDENCVSLYSTRNGGDNKCRNQNYLSLTSITSWRTRIWLLNPWKNTQADIWNISASVGINALNGAGYDGTSSRVQYASDSLNVHPALFLKANINLTGDGTENNPYKINKII